MSVRVSCTFTLPTALIEEIGSRASRRHVSIDELVTEYLGRAMSSEDFQERTRRQRDLVRSVPAPRLKLMADVGAPPLWNADRGGPVSLESLPLSPALLERLERWRKVYESYLAREGRYLEQQSNSAELDAFEREGLAIWQQLREELAGVYSVLYQSSVGHDLIAHPDDVSSSDQT